MEHNKRPSVKSVSPNLLPLRSLSHALKQDIRKRRTHQLSISETTLTSLAPTLGIDEVLLLIIIVILIITDHYCYNYFLLSSSFIEAAPSRGFRV